MAITRPHPYINHLTHFLMRSMNMYTLVREGLKNPNEPTFIRALAIFYWRTPLALLLLSLVGALTLGLWEFKAAASAFDQLKAPQQTPAPALNRKDIGALVSAFTAR